MEMEMVQQDHQEIHVGVFCTSQTIHYYFACSTRHFTRKQHLLCVFEVDRKSVKKGNCKFSF